MSEKRARSVNFSNEEKLSCLNLIKKYKSIIENKETGVVSWKQKEHVWKTIEAEFNAVSNTYRSADVLKRFYNNKKREARKQAAVEKKDLIKTGGGEPVKITDDPIFNLTLDIINKKTVYGLHNPVDGDSQFLSSIANEGEQMENYKEDTTQDNEEEIIILGVDPESNNDIGEVVLGTSWSDYTPKKLKMPVRQELKTLTTPSQSEWSSLRRPAVSKTENVALKYEEVADLKKVLNLQRKLLQEEEQHIQQKYKWEKEGRPRSFN